MFRPRASATSVPALAMASMLASLSCTIGNSTSRAKSAHSASTRRVSTRIPAKGRSRAALAAAIMGPSSGLVRGHAPQEAGWQEHEDQHQDREDDHVRPGGGYVGAAHRLDQADQDAADHGAGHVADAAQHGGGEGE